MVAEALEATFKHFKMTKRIGNFHLLHYFCSLNF
jgi:hypothetical protein